MDLRVFWSDRLDEMADRMLDDWGGGRLAGPFERTCVVVGDMATRNWLKDRFLLHRAPGSRRILANVDFVPLPEFANDWLAAAVHGASGTPRDPAAHPFSKGVMAWRLDAILRKNSGDPEFKVLSDYVSAGGPGAENRRRFDLATRLAQMFDDYLVSRHAMLHDWERGRIPPAGDARWQALLYRELARNARTYAADYAEALAPDFDPARAFANGFPRYAAVHVFDVADAPWPYLSMLAKLSEAVPVSFWTFNPSRDFWLEDPTKKQRLRELAARLRAELADGREPADALGDAPDFSTPDSRLLGALASGARGMLAGELDLTGGDCVWIGGGEGDFSSLRRVGGARQAEFHACHSPRRELEAARDALHRFFAEHPDAKPSDALVLCADWATYSPLVEAVFGGRDGAGLPFATAGMAADSPVAHAFGELLGFRSGRFAVSSVFSLLGIPEIRDKFGIESEDVAALRGMAKKANIHWGFDDGDVRAVLGLSGKPEDGERYRFTWQRGLDRLTLDALVGPREDEDAVCDAGPLGKLRPTGDVESGRAAAVGGLFRFARRLAKLRHFLQSSHAAEVWRDGLLAAIDDFFQPDDASLGEVFGLRRAVDSAAAAAARARETDRRDKNGEIPGDVFCAAVSAAVKDCVRRLAPAGDAVRIAPLSNGSAVPARFVWICGLNDGTFPRVEYRPTFDLVGRRPTMFDVTPRERDSLSLLKAALGARDRLCLSCIGRDIRTNAEVPPAVPLADLLEWFRASGIPVAAFGHPLQAYSGRYFRSGGGAELPPAFSAANREAAAAIAAAASARAADPAAAEATRQGIVPFPLLAAGETAIELDDLAEFVSAPNKFIAEKRLRLKVRDFNDDRLDDDDALDAGLPYKLSIRVKIRGKDGVPDAADTAETLQEKGVPLAAEDIARRVEEEDADTAPFRDRAIAYKKEESPGYAVQGMTAAQALARWEDEASATAFHVAFEIDGHRVSVNGASRTISLAVVPDGRTDRMDYSFSFSSRSENQREQEKKEMVVRHKRTAWIRHLAGHAAGGRFTTALVFGGMKDALRTYRPVEQAEAKRILEELVRLVVQPFPFDFSAISDEFRDRVPDDWAAVVDGWTNRVVSTRQPTGKKAK